MAEKEQLKPPPAITLRPTTAGEEATFYQKKTLRKKIIKCCGGAAALLLIETVFLLILIFTVLKVKGPVIKMDGVKVDNLELITGAATSLPGSSFSNMSLTAHVLVKNPSLSSFNYGTTNMTLYYRAVVIGEARGPPGKAKARGAMRMNVTVDIITDRLISIPYLEGDVSTGMLEMNGVARVGARMKILNIFKKHVVVKMNCSIFINITSQYVQKHKCKRNVKL